MNENSGKPILIELKAIEGGKSDKAELSFDSSGADLSAMGENSDRPSNEPQSAPSSQPAEPMPVEQSDSEAPETGRQRLRRIMIRYNSPLIHID